MRMKQLIERYQTDYYRAAQRTRRLHRLPTPPHCRNGPDRPISKRDTWTI